MDRRCIINGVEVASRRCISWWHAAVPPNSCITSAHAIPFYDLSFHLLFLHFLSFFILFLPYAAAARF